MTELRNIQLLQLMIAKEVKRICELHKIQYFMIGGTLLGAVRHKGFIPWDDDLDFGFVRSDYERFLEVCKTDLSDEYFLQTWDTDPEYALPFAKIRLKGTHFVEKNTGKAHLCEDGIFVDLFPFDKCKNPDKRQVKTAFYQRLLLMKNGYDIAHDGGMLKKAVYAGIKAVSLFFSRASIQRALQKSSMKDNGSDRAYLCDHYERPIQSSLTESLIPIPFEDDAFLSFSSYDEYLTVTYGDYMTPPPEDKRENYHGITRVELSKYKMD